MATWDDVTDIVAGLPDSTEPNRHEWRVRNKLFAWERPYRKVDLKVLGDDVWHGDILAARVPHEGAKQALLADAPDVYFTIPHFDGYPAVLVRLERIDEEELRELLVEAWLTQAPQRLAAAFLESLDP